MSKPLFVTDVDGVLLDMHSEFLRFFTDRYGVQVGPMQHWDFHVAFGIPEQEGDKIWDWLWDVPLYAHRGAINFLEQLKRGGYEVVALTRRKPGKAVEASKRDVTRNFGNLIDRLIFSNEQSKGEMMKDWHAEYFLDDAHNNIFSVARHSPGTKLFLMDSPWNQSQDIDPPYKRVKSFDAVLREVE